MTRIFVTVGISVYLNTIKWLERNNEDHYESAHRALGQAKKNSNADWDLLNKCAQNYLIRTGELKRSSAEVQSIEKIFNDLQWEQEQFIIHFISSHTRIARSAAKLLATYFEKHPRVNEKPEVKIIEGLQVESGDRFNDIGYQNLIHYIQTVHNKVLNINGIKCQLPCIINITAGYKGAIPILTIVGQLYEIPIVYIYEGTNELITLPGLPLSFDRSILESYHYYFSLLKEKKGKPKTHVLYASELIPKERQFFIASLLNKGFFKKVTNAQYQLTYLGTLIRDEVLKRIPNVASSFGQAIEFIFYEYLMRESLTIKGQPTNWAVHNYSLAQTKFDLGLFTSREEKELLAIGEVKSIWKILTYGDRSKKDYKKQLQTHIKTLVTNGKQKVTYLLFIYAIQQLRWQQKLFDQLHIIQAELNKNGIHLEVFTVKFFLEADQKRWNKNIFEKIYQGHLTRDPAKVQVDSKYGPEYFLVEPLTIS